MTEWDYPFPRLNYSEYVDLWNGEKVMPRKKKENSDEGPKKKRIYKKRGKKPTAPPFLTSSADEEAIKVDFCNHVREALDIDYLESTIFASMQKDAEFIEEKWESIGKVVLPYVYGGVAFEGPQSVIKNSFLIGYFLGALKERYRDEDNKWNNSEAAKFIKELK